MIAPALLLVLAASGGRGYVVDPPLPKATIAVFGDSIYSGVQGVMISSKLDQSLPEGYVAVNQAVSGTTAHEIATRMITIMDTACLGGPCGTYVIGGPVNTLKSDDFIWETDDNYIVQYALHGVGPILGIMDGIDKIHNRHPKAKVIAVGVLHYAGCQPGMCSPLSLVRAKERVEAYNAAFLAECDARPWLRCTSPAAEFEDPENPGHLRPDLVSDDGLHPNGEGHGQLTLRIREKRIWP